VAAFGEWVPHQDFIFAVGIIVAMVPEGLMRFPFDCRSDAAFHDSRIPEIATPCCKGVLESSLASVHQQSYEQPDPAPRA
jgi:hypothetical protein